MKEGEITKFLVSFSGQIEYVIFPGGVFDDQLYIQYEIVWGPDWDPVSGLTSGTSQMSRSGKDPERVVFNMPVETVFSSTNVSGCTTIVSEISNTICKTNIGICKDFNQKLYDLEWGHSVLTLHLPNLGPQLIITVRAQNTFSGDTLSGYGLVLMPPTTGTRMVTAPLVRPQAATMLGEWLAWLTGRYPELADPKMLANGKENYLLRTESYGSVTAALSMVSKDLRKLGYDNQPPYVTTNSDRFSVQ